MGWLRARSRAIIAAALFLSLLAVYQLNGDLLVTHDATSNVYLPLSVLSEGNVSFTPREVPFMFIWELHAGGKNEATEVRRFDETIESLWKSGELRVREPRYQLVPSRHEGVYVDSFGLGAGLTALPGFAVLQFFAGSLAERPKLLFYAAKFVASAAVAGSAVFVFLTAAQLVSTRAAAAVALIYGLGTCVWSTSSQTLMQHGPNELFLAMSIYFFVRARGASVNHPSARPLAKGEKGQKVVHRQHPALTAAAAASGAAAVLCRPTSAIVVLAMAAYLLWVDRKALVVFALAGAPFAMALAAYNAYYLGSPLSFGQMEFAEWLARGKTGSPEVWQTPLWLGATGHLVSPSRGLLVFSPFFVFVAWGLWLVWRQKELGVLRPLSLAALAILCVESKHFDWWSGWSYGYRHIVDLTPLLALFLAPVVERLPKHKWLLAVFAVLVGWSVGVQLLGATAFNGVEWNNRLAYQVYLPGRDEPVTVLDEKRAREMLTSPAAWVAPVELNIDNPKNRYRLWSLRDNQILCYLQHFREGRSRRVEMGKRLYEDADPGRALAATYFFLAHALERIGHGAAAQIHYQKTLELDPRIINAHVERGTLLAKEGRDAEALAEFERTLELEPKYAVARLNIAAILMRQGRYEQAIPYLRAGLRESPFSQKFHGRLAVSLDETGKTSEAIEHYIDALRGPGDDPNLRGRLAGALARLGRTREAVEAYRAVVRLDPHAYRAATELAWILATSAEAALRDGTEALDRARAACRESNNQYAPALDALAAAYAESGQYNDAVRVATWAVEAARAAGDKVLATAIEARLDLYRQRQPYRAA